MPPSTARAARVHAPAYGAPARRRSGTAPRPARAPRDTRGAPLGARVGTTGTRLVDRLLRGRGWVMLIGSLLAGIVFLNVSLLQLNQGIAQTAARSAALERDNSVLRARLATVDTAQSIQSAAQSLGYVLPQPGDVGYLTARPGDASAAAQRLAAAAGSTGATGATGGPGAAGVSLPGQAVAVSSAAGGTTAGGSGAATGGLSAGGSGAATGGLSAGGSGAATGGLSAGGSGAAAAGTTTTAAAPAATASSPSASGTPATVGGPAGPSTASGR